MPVTFLKNKESKDVKKSEFKEGSINVKKVLTNNLDDYYVKIK